MALLKVDNLQVFYGAIEALRGVSLRVEAGEVVTLIGGNGAGKSTTLRTISGLLQPKRGTIQFDGRPIQGWPPHRIVQSGLVQVPEGREIFANLTVDENLQIASFTRKDRDGIRRDRERALNLFPRVRERLRQLAGTLSGGEQQMLAIARILRTGARLLLLDEPTEGLAPVIIQQIGKTIRTLKEQGFTILLVEQNFRFAQTVADRYYVMEHGRIIDKLLNSEIEANLDKLPAYLGV